MHRCSLQPAVRVQAGGRQQSWGLVVQAGGGQQSWGCSWGREGLPHNAYVRGTLLFNLKRSFWLGAAQIPGPMLCFNQSQIFFNNPKAAGMWVRCVRAENKGTDTLSALRFVENFPSSCRIAWLAPAGLLASAAPVKGSLSFCRSSHVGWLWAT